MARLRHSIKALSGASNGLGSAVAATRPALVSANIGNRRKYNSRGGHDRSPAPPQWWSSILQHRPRPDPACVLEHSPQLLPRRRTGLGRVLFAPTGCPVLQDLASTFSEHRQLHVDEKTQSSRIVLSLPKRQTDLALDDQPPTPRGHSFGTAAHRNPLLEVGAPDAPARAGFPQPALDRFWPVDPDRLLNCSRVRRTHSVDQRSMEQVA